MKKTSDKVNGIAVYELENFSELTSKLRDDVRAELDKGSFVVVRFDEDWLIATTPTYAVFNRELALSQVRCFNFLSRLDHALWRAMNRADQGYAQLDRDMSR